MAAVKFTRNQIDRFNDKVEHCLEDGVCRQVFKDYIENILKKDNVIKTLQLWCLVANPSDNEGEFLDLIVEIDDFNSDPLLSLNELNEKIEYVKNQCCKLLGNVKVHKRFINYLKDKHMQ